MQLLTQKITSTNCRGLWQYGKYQTCNTFFVSYVQNTFIYLGETMYSHMSSVAPLPWVVQAKYGSSALAVSGDDDIVNGTRVVLSGSLITQGEECVA